MDSIKKMFFLPPPLIKLLVSKDFSCKTIYTFDSEIKCAVNSVNVAQPSPLKINLLQMIYQNL